MLPAKRLIWNVGFSQEVSDKPFIQYSSRNWGIIGILLSIKNVLKLDQNIFADVDQSLNFGGNLNMKLSLGEFDIFNQGIHCNW